MMKPKKPMMGPATKKEAKKAAPKVPMTPAKTAEMKKAKRKETMAKVAGAGTVVVGAAADMINTKRRLTGKSYLGNKKRP
jgi:hypothetical protein